MATKDITLTSRFAAQLLEWYTTNGRDLPWRHTQDPYAIWLSEIILQQTRITQGTDYWYRFMNAWPTVNQLAAASEDEVLRQWQGLGYYSRARNLHTAAQQIVAQGAFPQTYEGILALKGVGPYTAAAIASFAFNLPKAVVDGNVYRVLSRYFGINTPIDTTQGQYLFQKLAQELLPPSQTANYNQAIMDFGALQCTPRTPQCNTCPLLDTCLSAHEGTQELLPTKQGKIKVRHRYFIYICLTHQGKIALRRRPAGDIWQGLWEPLLIERTAEEKITLPPWAAEARLMAVDQKHVLTHQVLHTDFYTIEAKQQPILPEGYQWIIAKNIKQYALPRLIEKLFETLHSTNLFT